MMRMPIWMIVISYVYGDDHAGHGHGDGGVGYEWAGLFTAGEDFYQWTAQKRLEHYAEGHMKIAILPAADNTKETLHALETEGLHALNMTCVELDAGESMVPMEDACQELHFEDDVWQSLFIINASRFTHFAIFTEHNPLEFERDSHYLKVLSTGADVEPAHELPEVAAER